MANRKTTWTDITPAYIDILLDPHFSHEAKQDAIENLMEDDAKRQKFGQNARVMVEQELCDAVIIRETLDVISGKPGLIP